MNLKKIIQNQQWDFTQIVNYVYIEEETYKIVCSFSINVDEDTTTLNNVYVDEEFRNKGLFNMMMRDVLNYQNDVNMRDLVVYVNRNNFIYNKYIKLGFEFVKRDKNSVYDEMLFRYVKKSIGFKIK